MILAAAIASSLAAEDFLEPERLCLLSDPRLNEISGIIPVTGLEGTYWVHNDSGDKARIFAVHERGSVAAEVLVKGGTATDWEDIALGPGPGGSRRIFIADTGNNGLSRQELVIFRFTEPALARDPSGKQAAPGQTLESEPAAAIRFRYPRGARDCEAIAVDPVTADIYLITKQLLFRAEVYRLRDDPEGLQTAEEVAVMFPATPVTAADLSADGRRLLLRTYFRLEERTLPGGAPLAEIFRAEASAVPTSLFELQGEAACYDHDGRAIVTVNEGKPKVLHRTRRKTSSPLASPLSPPEALRRFRITPGYRLELAAAEPEVVDPVAAVFDGSGRLWVVEMGDYPLGPPAGMEPQGRVRLLEDRDGDGRFELSVLFAGGLHFPTGVAPWKDGVYVTAQRETLFLEDTTGDGRADRKEVVFSGFRAENTQLLPNHPTWALDNRLYVANGLRATDVQVAGAAGKQPISIRGRDFRFDPLTGSVEAVAGVSQFGMAFDDEGNRFLCSNRNHLQHVVIEDRYASRSPHLAISSVVEDPPDHGAAGRVYPLTRNWTTSNLHAGTFTAACGVLVYRGGLLADARGDAFVCEPPGNLVHRDRLRATGATFVASRVERESEFLASGDEWFRPVNLAEGPDGALYVVDMYRATIEHPDWLPPDYRQRFDFTLGNDRGRIWRVVPQASPPATERAPVPRLDGAPVERLVEALSDPGGCRRDTAQRLIVQGRLEGAVPRLVENVREAPSPLGRLHAMWTLEGLGRLEPEIVEQALADPDARVRKSALRLAERWLPGRGSLAGRIVDLARGEADPGVQFQLTLTLGSIEPAAAVGPLAAMAGRHAADGWFRSAVLTSAPADPSSLILRLFDPRREPDQGTEEMVRELAALAARKDDQEARAVLFMAVSALAPLEGQHWHTWLGICLAGLDQGARQRGRSLRGIAAAAEGSDARRAVEALGDSIALAARDAADARISRRGRLAAIRVLWMASFHDAGAALGPIIDGDPDPDLRAAAVTAFRGQDDPDTAAFLLGRWRTATPAVREEILRTLTSRDGLTRHLLDAVERGELPPAEIGPGRRSALLAHPSQEIQGRAQTLLGKPASDRAAVIAAFRPALETLGNAGRGREIFRKACAACHRVDGIGVDTGPDISDTRERSPESLLHDILDPNRAVDGRYLLYTVTTPDGRVLSGVIESETASAVTLRGSEGRTEAVLRADIASIASAGSSLMPEGLEKDVGVEAMADLIAFLKGWRFEGKGKE